MSCAHRAIEALGLAPRGSLVRASLAHDNTPDEVARFVRALGRAIG